VTLFWLVLLVAIVVEATIHTFYLFTCSINIAKKARSDSQRVGGSKSR
jgi:hypothetical protein